MSRNVHFAVGAGMASPHLVAGAARYSEGMGLQEHPLNFSTFYAHPEMTRRIADAYTALPDYDRAAVPHFKAMADETERQFDYLTRAQRHGGLGVNVEVTPHDPYNGPAEMFQDLRENNRIKVLSTGTTGGHPIFSNAQNDQFRAVHDAFGHMATGRGVDRHGEEAAYQAHSRMYSPTARMAMATETRGQNSAMIAAGGVFQDQKMATLPQELTRPMVPLIGRRTAPAALQQARQFHTVQFGSAL